MSRSKDAAEMAASKKRTDQVIAQVGVLADRLQTELERLEQVLSNERSANG